MKKSQLKQVLKPLIKECIKEVIFEEGILSGIISEVVQGLGANTLVEQKRAPVPVALSPERVQQEAQAIQEIRENKQKMLDAIGKEAYGGIDLFEGTAPIAAGGDPSSATPSHGPMSNIDPDDAGVDIGGIMNLAGGSWKQI